MVTRTAVVASRVGLHARPAAIFVNAVMESGYDIAVSFDGEEADAASVIEVMSLGISCGDEVTLSAEDTAAESTLDALVELLGQDLDA